MSDSRPILGLTMGDPAGIGPEVVVKALTEAQVRSWCRPVVLGDIGALHQAARLTGRQLSLTPWEPGQALPDTDRTMAVLELSQLASEDIQSGLPRPAGGLAAARYIEKGAELALAGTIQGLVTAPISKEALNLAGYKFPGHTEFLAHKAGHPPVVMMLAGSRLKVVLVTIHEALALVPTLLTPERILTTARITHQALQKYFGLAQPKLAVAALNPHAGEGGLFGVEEKNIIEPAIRLAQDQGLELSGPHPPDTLFYRAANGEFDAVVCMYHDQGLIPFKLLHFQDGVNVTLGLPFIRTSVDHGTAYDLAGKNQADHHSLLAALGLAANMAAGQR
jgi:4-hydroxythreonine-4-phosphate dehydrogenase